MRLSPRRTLTFLLTVCMIVILYLNVLSFLDHQQRVASLYALQGGLADEEEQNAAFTGRYVIRGGEVLGVDSERYRELLAATKRQEKGDGELHHLAGIRTVRLHAGLDTTRILLDAKEGVHHKGPWPPASGPVARPHDQAAAFREIRPPTKRFKGRRRSIWPDPERPYDDRILDQILFVPESVKKRRRKQEAAAAARERASLANATRAEHGPEVGRRKEGLEAVRAAEAEGDLDGEDAADETPSLKTILMWSGMGDFKAGRAGFVEERCAVDSCYVTENPAIADRADAIVFNFDPVYYSWTRPPHQLWILWMLESPLHTSTLHDMKDQVNWTATYRADSTLVTPYEKFVTYKDTPLPAAPDRDFAAGKTKKVAWFVSNCGARNRRLEYAEELSKFIQVDIYGGCGPFRCSRLDQDACLDILRRDYKFYLAFENSNCDYYITEKFFWNGLKADVIPIVMGARRDDYLAAAPPFSYIHVEDFSSPRDLAVYLDKLDKNETMYNSYFRWKTMGEFINTKFWCRLCSMLHDDNMPAHHYANIEQWWRPNGTCTLDRWDSPSDHINDWKKYVYSNL